MSLSVYWEVCLWFTNGGRMTWVIDQLVWGVVRSRQQLLPTTPWTYLYTGLWMTRTADRNWYTHWRIQSLRASPKGAEINSSVTSKAMWWLYSAAAHCNWLRQPLWPTFFLSLLSHYLYSRAWLQSLVSVVAWPSALCVIGATRCTRVW